MVPVAVIELNEADAPLGQAAGEQTVGGERAIASPRAIQVEDVLRFVADIHQLGNARLHLEGHLVLADASGDFRIGRGGVAERVERLDRVDEITLPLGRDAVGTPHIKHGVAHAAELDALKTAGQKARVPLPRGDGLLLPVVARRHHDDEAGESPGRRSLARTRATSPWPADRRPSSRYS